MMFSFLFIFHEAVIFSVSCESSLCSEYKSLLDTWFVGFFSQRILGREGAMGMERGSLHLASVPATHFSLPQACGLHQDFLGQRVPWLSHRNRKLVWPLSGHPQSGHPFAITRDRPDMPLVAQRVRVLWCWVCRLQGQIRVGKNALCSSGSPGHVGSSTVCCVLIFLCSYGWQPRVRSRSFPRLSFQDR